jgi:hypothetical protein
LFFPYHRINQVPVIEVLELLVQVFQRWGKPGSIRVDNGEPFGSPKSKPNTPLALWLIANDIDMIFNRPYCPQMNAKVEKMQDTTQRWAEIDNCQNIKQLQMQLNAQIIVQRTEFKVTRLENKTRLETFPELETSRRVYNSQDFDAQKVYNFLAKKTYPRKVSSAGQITHFGHKIQISTRYSGQYVNVKFNPIDISWQVYSNQNLIATIKADYLSSENIKNMTVFQ